MVKLRPRARIIRTVGDQLISGAEAAVIELVKNAYDADATLVSISVAPPRPNAAGGRIVVVDNGVGMTSDDVIHKWFEPATDDKVRKLYSAKGRRLLGAKGIGRFAAARLGQHLAVNSVASNTLGTYERVTFEIDWERFDATVFLEDIDIEVHVEQLGQLDAQQSGVQLTILELRDRWTEKRLRNLIRELRRLLLPSAAGGDFRIDLNIGEFTSDLDGIDGAEVFRSANISAFQSVSESESWRVVPFTLNEHADYRLRGEFSAEGEFSGSFAVLRGDGVEMPIRIAPPAMDDDQAPCGVVGLSLLIYDREPDSIAQLFERMGLTFSEIGIQAARGILNDNSGVALFREGFRIRPYGDPEFDWLELERNRVQDPSRRIGLNQISGQLDIGGESESGLVERSSREGFEHSPQFERLRRLTRHVIRHTEERRVTFREKAGIGRKASANLSGARDAARLESIAAAIRRQPEPVRVALEKALTRDATRLQRLLDEIEEFQKMLQSRAALGLVVAQVVHEGRRFINPMASSVRALQSVREDLLADTKRGEVVRRQFPEHLESLELGTSGLARLFKTLDPISGRRRGRPSKFRPDRLLQDCFSLFDDAIRVARVRVAIDVPQGLWLYGYPEDLQSATLNVLENALFWVGTAPLEKRSIEVTVSSQRREAVLQISNSGAVIDDAYLPRLFEAGFSLRSEGSGLGLAIAREAVRRSKGEMWYDGSSGRACFMISFPLPPEGA